jgi:hypothetical protein
MYLCASLCRVFKTQVPSRVICTVITVTANPCGSRMPPICPVAALWRVAMAPLSARSAYVLGALSQFDGNIFDVDTGSMKPKRPRDTNQLAKMIVDLTTREITEADPDQGKDPKAIERGRKGGVTGGRARASALTPARRAAIARKAAKARWRQ